MNAFPVNIRLGQRADVLLSERPPAPALFLDRDGVINIDRNYVGRVEDVELVPGAAAAIAACNQAGVLVVVVSNQSGVARRYFGWDAVVAVEERIAELLALEGAWIDLLISAGVGPEDEAGSSFRKPSPGMLKLAARIAPIDIHRSWIVGDKESDLQAGAAAGLRGGFLVGEAARPEPHQRPAQASSSFEAFFAADLSEAADRLREYLTPPSTAA
ncbi:D-glycero-D-manno-heptose 1,7-bisphosphate phosphatase [Faunimonas pinastri]|uniref:D,D-heptose 1,7-bisphosphate phosphatase n=1 Tax=Faunimonas pinastri TaxID=1855383 RepID=A0A1H9PNA1_9HYPH|nr:HAD-IIIA family hydrolase [Faunimonas pinastri]SER49305.1 D-glycero-D-manno-heptose 1,7-bisphosphate phosphatase [Faunimonas pinastri]